MSQERTFNSHLYTSTKTKHNEIKKSILFKHKHKHNPNHNPHLKHHAQQGSLISSYMKQAPSLLPRITINTNNSCNQLKPIKLHNITNSIELQQPKPNAKISQEKPSKLKWLAEKSLKKLYGFDYLFVKKIKDIKKDNEIAAKKDFKIDKYQKRLISFASQARFSRKAVRDLSINMDALKYRFENKHKPYLGKWSILASSIQAYAPKFLLEKLESM